MGDPTYKRYIGDNGKTYWVLPEGDAEFRSSMQGAGIRVVGDSDAPMGPLPGMHYGPEDPSKGHDEGVSAQSMPGEEFPPRLHEGERLPIQKPVPSQPYFPPKDPALAASDNAAVADAIAHGRNHADVPYRDSTPAASNPDAGVADEVAGVPDDMDAGVPDEPAAPIDPKLAKSREKLAASDARRSGQEPLGQGDRTYDRGTKAERVSELETAARSFMDVASYGAMDEAVGAGGFVRGLLKPTVRPLGPDPSLMDRFESAKAEGGDYMRRYADRDKRAFETQPLMQFVGGVIPAVVQSAAGRWLMPNASMVEEGVDVARRAAPMIQEGAEVARRAGSGVGKLIERTVASAKDALFNPGTVAQSVASGVGHAEGPDPGSWLKSAATGAVGEHLVGAAMAAPAELAVTPFRAVGRHVAERLSDEMANSETAHLHQLARKAGATYETFPRPAGGARGPAYPMTSGRGVRPGPESMDVMAKARNAGPGELAPRLRGQAAGRVAEALDTEAQTFKKSLKDRREEHYATPEAKANTQAELEVLRAAPADIRRELAAKMRELAEHRSVQGVPGEGMDAQMLDQLIEHVDAAGKTHTANSQYGDIERYAVLAERLRQVRKDHFGTARWIAETHADKMRAHEARKTQMGIPAESKGVDPTTRGKDTQAINQRLARGPSPDLLDEIADIEAGDPNFGREPDPETARLLRQWAGIDAQQRLITGAKDEGLDIGVRAGKGPGLLARVGEILPSINRVAGLENLGMHTQAALRGGMREAVQDLAPEPYGGQLTPEEVKTVPEKVKWLVRLLGYDNQSPADLQRIVQMIEGQQQP